MIASGVLLGPLSHVKKNIHGTGSEGREWEARRGRGRLDFRYLFNFFSCEAGVARAEGRGGRYRRDFSAGMHDARLTLHLCRLEG